MRTKQLLSVGSVVGLLAAAWSPAGVVYLQDVGGNDGFTFNGTPVTQATFDDTYLQTGGSASTLAANFGSAGSLQIRTTSSGLVNFGIIAVKDMFTLVPPTDNGNPIVINSAKLHLASSGSNQGAGYTVNVRRITTDWLENDAGDNENRASGNKRNALTPGAALSDGDSWAGGSGNYGSADYTATNAVLGADFANAVFGAYKAIDVTGIVTDMYNLGVNYGFSVSTGVVQDGFVNIRASEDTLLPGTHETFRPVLEINFSYVPEPASMTLLGLGAGGLLLRRRRV